MRAVSTVLDVAAFLLLVSVAVATLTIPVGGPPAATADETAATLAAATTNVTYPSVHPQGAASALPRTAAGTHAGLLGRAAVANLTLSGEALAPATVPFRRAVRNGTERALDWAPGRTGVVAVWEPYPDAPIRGRIAAGAKPPAGVDVATARLVVPASIPPARSAARRAADGGYRAVARPVTGAILTWTLPRDANARSGAAGEARLAAYADALGPSKVGVGDDGRYETARARIERRLTRVLAADMRERYATPAAAAADVRTGTVRIVVREWSP